MNDSRFWGRPFVGGEVKVPVRSKHEQVREALNHVANDLYARDSLAADDLANAARAMDEESLLLLWRSLR
jgi:hypothetical protein